MALSIDSVSRNSRCVSRIPPRSSLARSRVPLHRRFPGGPVPWNLPVFHSSTQKNSRYACEFHNAASKSRMCPMVPAGTRPRDPYNTAVPPSCRDVEGRALASPSLNIRTRACVSISREREKKEKKKRTVVSVFESPGFCI